MVMKSCGTMPRAPLRFFGASSPRYMGTTLDERPADRDGQLKLDSKMTSDPHYMNNRTYLTCTDAHYKSSCNDDLIGLSNLADSHHNSRNYGEDVVEEEGALPVED